MTDTATLTTRLAEAEAALHSVQIGRNVRMLGHDGKTVTYNSTNIADLKKYILELKTALGTATKRRAFRPYF